MADLAAIARDAVNNSQGVFLHMDPAVGPVSLVIVLGPDRTVIHPYIGDAIGRLLSGTDVTPNLVATWTSP